MFFSSRSFAAIGSRGPVLLVSFQALRLFILASLQMWIVQRQNPKAKSAKSKGKSTREDVGGEAAGVCGVGGKLFEEVITFAGIEKFCCGKAAGPTAEFTGR